MSLFTKDSHVSPVSKIDNFISESWRIIGELANQSANELEINHERGEGKDWYYFSWYEVVVLKIVVLEMAGEA